MILGIYNTNDLTKPKKVYQLQQKNKASNEKQTINNMVILPKMKFNSFSSEFDNKTKLNYLSTILQQKNEKRSTVTNFELINENKKQTLATLTSSNEIYYYKIERVYNKKETIKFNNKYPMYFLKDKVNSKFIYLFIFQIHEADFKFTIDKINLFYKNAYATTIKSVVMNILLPCIPNAQKRKVNYIYIN